MIAFIRRLFAKEEPPENPVESRELLGDKMRRLQQESVDNAWRERPHLHIKKLMQAQRQGYGMDIPSAQVLARMLPIAFALGAEHEEPAQAVPHNMPQGVADEISPCCGIPHRTETIKTDFGVLKVVACPRMPAGGSPIVIGEVDDGET